MASRVKRTYNLPPETVRRVRELADEYAVAGSQDAVIELAVDELVRRLRDLRETDAWASAAGDPELESVTDAFATADRETWPR